MCILHKAVFVVMDEAAVGETVAVELTDVLYA